MRRKPGASGQGRPGQKVARSDPALIYGRLPLVPAHAHTRFVFSIHRPLEMDPWIRGPTDPWIRGSVDPWAATDPKAHGSNGAQDQTMQGSGDSRKSDFIQHADGLKGRRMIFGEC